MAAKAPKKIQAQFATATGEKIDCLVTPLTEYFAWAPDALKNPFGKCCFLIHLPTCLGPTPGVVYTKKEAFEIARRLESLAGVDWSSADSDAISAQVGAAFATLGTNKDAFLTLANASEEAASHQEAFLARVLKNTAWKGATVVDAEHFFRCDTTAMSKGPCPCKRPCSRQKSPAWRVTHPSGAVMHIRKP